MLANKDTIQSIADNNLRTAGGFGDSLVRWISNRKMYIVVCFATLGVVAGCFAPLLFAVIEDKISWSALPGTPSDVAIRQFEQHFPDVLAMDTESLLIFCEDCQSLVEGDLGKAVKGFVGVLDEHLQVQNSSCFGCIHALQSYYDFLGVLDPNPMLSDDSRSMMYQWRWHVPNSRAAHAAAISLDISQLAAERCRSDATLRHHGVHAMGTGTFAAKRDSLDANVQDVGKHALVFLPVGLLIVAIRVRSFPMVLLPVMTACGSVLTSFALVSAIARRLSVNSMAPALITFFCIALSVDYSLFLLARYSDERRYGETVLASLSRMMDQGGHAVLLSGSVLVCACASGALMPGGFAGMAAATSTACMSCLLWNLLLIPSALACAPSFFEGACWSRCGSMMSRGLERGISGNETRSNSDNIDSEQGLTQSMWFAWGSCITLWPRNVCALAVAAALCTPLTLRFWTFKPSIDLVQTLPASAPSTIASAEMRAKFSAGAGCPTPLYVLLRPRPSESCPSTVESGAFFLSSCEFAQDLVAATQSTSFKLSAENLLGVAFHPQFQTTVTPNVTCFEWYNGITNFEPDATSLLTGNGLLKAFVQIRHLYMKLWNRMVSDDKMATIIAINPRQDATSVAGFDLVKTIRNVGRQAGSRIRDLGSMAGRWNSTSTLLAPIEKPRCDLDVYLLSQASVVADFVHATMSSLPYALGCTIVLSFLLVGVAFRAAFLPLKLMLTVGLPISWSYGLAVYFFTIGGGEGLLWSIPAFTSTLLLGLGLDYDLFLFSRIWELRQVGFSSNDSIRLGMAGTGSIVASAGFVFIFEFSGLLLSSIPANNQIGTVIVLAVLIDVIVVENCVVPALLSLGSDLNFWPFVMPPVTKSVGKPFGKARGRSPRGESASGTVPGGLTACAKVAKETAVKVPFMPLEPSASSFSWRGYEPLSVAEH